WYGRVVASTDRQKARKEITRRLMQLAPRQRLDALLEESDARALVRSVAAEDLYLTILEVGIADATEIVQLASPTQFRTFIDLAALRTLIGDLFARNPLEAARLIESTRWEVPTELEETAYQFRAARLEDLGFPQLYEAMKIFAFVDPEKYAPRAAGSAAGQGL